MLREIAWYAQLMTRIGNWISTWKREINENDFTSGTIAYAIDSGVISIDELKTIDRFEIINKVESSEVEKELLDKWNESYHTITRLGKKMKSVDSQKILLSLEKVMFAHLISTGHK